MLIGIHFCHLILLYDNTCLLYFTYILYSSAFHAATV